MDHLLFAHELVHIILILIVVTSFHLHIRNANEVIWQFWDGKFSIRHSRHIPIPVLVTIFPIHGLAVVVKKNPPLAASPLVEDFFFTTPAKPFMTQGENSFSTFVALPLKVEKSHPHFSALRDWAIYLKAKP